jgi:hypothetical protein
MKKRERERERERKREESHLIMLSFSIKADICTINEMYSKPDIF